ncbi:MAG: hypothetical protein IJV98_00010 [Clostridia bacterium]|nr:hypothetical protein [Clostridia bacterium]
MDHLQNQKNEGTLVIHATSGSDAIPVEGATVIVRMSGAEGAGDILRVLVTDESGLTAPIRIETPSPAESLSPNGATPYTAISAEISEPRYYSTAISGIPIYPGITSIQPVRMIPRAGREGSIGFPEQTVVIREGPSLPSL